VNHRWATDSERDTVERRADGHPGEQEAVGLPRSMSHGWARRPCVAIDVEVTEPYVRSPGPATNTAFNAA
jgi:hypothetical protein